MNTSPPSAYADAASPGGTTEADRTAAPRPGHRITGEVDGVAHTAGVGGRWLA